MNYVILIPFSKVNWKAANMYLYKSQKQNFIICMYVCIVHIWHHDKFHSFPLTNFPGITTATSYTPNFMTWKILKWICDFGILWKIYKSCWNINFTQIRFFFIIMLVVQKYLREIKILCTSKIRKDTVDAVNFLPMPIYDENNNK